MIDIGFATAGVVSAQTTVDVGRKVTCKVFYFRETLNAFVSSHTVPDRNMKQLSVNSNTFRRQNYYKLFALRK